MTCNLWPRPRKTLYLVSYRYINNTCKTERVPNIPKLVCRKNLNNC